MRYLVEWEEEQTVIVKLSGTVEADSENEVYKKIREGDVDVTDETMWDCIDSTIRNISTIEEEEEEE